MGMPELLAPAGDAESLRAALQYGADAVYVGAKAFGMRAAAKNFDDADLARAAAAVHAQGKRLYLTVNTLPRNEELAVLPQFLQTAAACGVDAMIVADLGVLTLIHKLLPQMELHASTQTGVVNSATANALFALGVKRVVLARELSLSEIKEIRAQTPPALELEAFVHGAMCMSVSGRCLLSEYLTGRDANRGACAQACRWRYHLVEEQRPGQFFPIGESETGSFILNAKDLCMLPHLRALADAGISSFKIEGRAKSFFYVAGITNAYRAVMNALFADPPQPPPDWALAEVDAVSHRPYSTGFYFGKPKDSIYPESSGYLRECAVVAVVEHCENDRLFVTQRNRFFDGDVLEVLCPAAPPRPLVVQDLQDADGNAIAAANHAVMACSMKTTQQLPAGAILRKRQTTTTEECNISQPRNGADYEL